MLAGEASSWHRAPGVGDDREVTHAVVIEDEPHGCRDLVARILGAAEWSIGLGRLDHLGIRIGTAKAVKASPQTRNPAAHRASRQE